MKLRQLQFVVEVARNGLNLTTVAERLYTSQPAISKQIRLLEHELDTAIFVRQGRRLVAITPAGQRIVSMAERMLLEQENIKRFTGDLAKGETGTLTLATTHTQARYVLPAVIQKFRRSHPSIILHIRQGTPEQIARMAAEGEADFAIATEALEHFTNLQMYPCYSWNRCILTPPDHPLAKLRDVSLEALAQYALVTYSFGFTGRSQLDHAFAKAELEPDVVLTAVDADVIKTYVKLGLGVGIVARMAVDPDEAGLECIDAEHLFERSVTHLGSRQGVILRRYMYDFIELFAPHLTRQRLDAHATARSNEKAEILDDLNARIPHL